MGRRRIGVSRGGGQSDRADERGKDRLARQRRAMHRWSPMVETSPKAGWATRSPGWPMRAMRRTAN
ncbi:hypothetical protein BURMUCGD2M_3748 [Burkholderia multivorans CGD2M]|uniref:Uncharacterized protein n=1 Tax=Burkholderia multivorans CGD2 TaxID=513052 RepID=B9BUM0_9BURK|nr:hypothetical protein BURMUCGD2_3760 [Burkholderia multivorans CGD2]EEE11789.1 hypothetical protein BURMUCGD2M_3748 [Burkholderia multivorans CGD2M]PRE66575.1 hypothetical protein C6P86_14585 [Burkholderia multivorans]